MALPLDLAMEDGIPWPRAVELTGMKLAHPCQNTILQHEACRIRARGVWLERLKT